MAELKFPMSLLEKREVQSQTGKNTLDLSQRSRVDIKFINILVYVINHCTFDNCSICAYGILVSRISARFVSNVIFALQLYNRYMYLMRLKSDKKSKI